MAKSYISNSNQINKPAFSAGNLSFAGKEKTTKTTYRVEGMTCGNCSAHVQKALITQKGVIDAKVDPYKSLVSIEYLSNLTSPQTLKFAVDEAGYNMIIDEEDHNKNLEIEKQIEDIKTSSDKEASKVQFPVLGMTCAACSAHVQKALKNQKGVRYSSVNLANNTAYIEYNTQETSPEQLKKAVEDAGYNLVIETEDKDKIQDIKAKEYNTLKRNCISALALGIPLSIIAMFFHTIPYANYIMWALATPIVFIFGAPFFVNTRKQLKHRTSNMDTLVALSTGIAYLFSVFNTLYPEFWTDRGLDAHVYFEVSGIVIAFVLLGRLLEAKAKRSTSNAIEGLIGIQPKTATAIRNGKPEDILISEIVVGDIILIKAGEKIAVDGTITDGHSFIDESMISGEPLAVEKTSGDKLYSGTINQSGNLHFRADKVGKDTFLAQIIKTVEEAQGSRAPIQNIVDRIASVFVPIIVILSILTFAIWTILGHDNNISQGLLSAVTVLIIACPCALGLATPTAIMVGIGRGATQGILIKDAEALESALKVTSIVLDKTGTITEGRPQVNNIQWYNHNQIDKDILYNIESYSDHPLAQAIIDIIGNRSKLLTDIKVSNLPGLGLEAEYKSKKYFVGSIKLIKNNGIDFSAEAQKWLSLKANNANTIVYFADDSRIIASLAISDMVRATSKPAIEKLKSMGLDVYMLTGDNQGVAEKVASEVGIKHVVANVLPTEKAGFVKSLQDKGEIVAMVGDGINDSAALATADLSIAMGRGSDIAIDAAQITIMSSDLNLLAKAINLSKATVRTIRQNLFWAFIYNIIGIPLAAGILYPINGFLLNPMIAGAAMALSSVCVVTNSLLLKFRKI